MNQVQNHGSEHVREGLISIAPEVLMALCIFQSVETSAREKHRQDNPAPECTVRHPMPAGEDLPSSPAGPIGSTRGSGANCPCR